MHRIHTYLSHLHIKFERNVIFILLFLFFIAGFVTSEYFAKQELQMLLKLNNQCKSQLVKSSSNTSSLLQQDIDLYVDKTNTLNNITSTSVSFTSKVTSLSPTKKEITISLTGNSEMKIDAADLSLTIPNTLKVISVLPGDAFASYKRNVITNSQVIISGTTLVNGSEITFGQPNKPFITLIIEKIGPPTQEEVLVIEKEKTKVFFQGVSILDETKSISKIIL